MEDKDSSMPFLQHLVELSTCLKKSLIGIFVCSLLAFNWSKILFDFITSPLFEHFQKVELIGTGPAEAFIVKLKVALVSGLIISSPLSFYQLWKFVAPGLYQKEKKYALPFVFGSTACFLIGVSFCYFVIFPYAFQFFLAEYESIGIAPTIRIGEYLSFCVKLILVFGLVFELPILSLFLTRMGVLSHTWLIDKGRYAVVVIFVLGAMLTPPDVVTQVLLAVPLIILYGICIIIAYAFKPQKAGEGSATDNSGSGSNA